LGLVEAVDLVDEDDHRLAEHLPVVLGPGHDLLDFLDAGQHCAEEGIGHVEVAGQHHGQGRLARPRRPPEDERHQAVGLDELGEDLALAEEMVLAVKLGEGAGPHPFGQGNSLFGLVHGPIIAKAPGQVVLTAKILPVIVA